MRMDIFPKQKKEDTTYQITEMLGGKNLGLFKIGNDLVIIEKKQAYMFSNIENIKKHLPTGLYKFLIENGKDLIDKLEERAGIYGEWIAEGQQFLTGLSDYKLYVYAKATLVGGVKSKQFGTDDLTWFMNELPKAFKDNLVPEYVGVMPLVKMTTTSTIEHLNKLYESYNNSVNREVKGFIVVSENGTYKYTRSQLN